MSISEMRRNYQRHICKQVVGFNSKKGNDSLKYPNFADGDNNASCMIARGIVDRLYAIDTSRRISGQTAGNRFEKVTAAFIEEVFKSLRHIRPGNWFYSTSYDISKFDQYEHLVHLDQIKNSANDPKLAMALADSYIIRPDIVVGRKLLTDDEINQNGEVVEDGVEAASMTPLRLANVDDSRPLLHASISCKWTLRSDRAQNARTEALNLIRNRKGHLPHIAVVTAEPLPTRLAAIALGTGDVDCVYHFALPEMRAAIEEIDNEDQKDMLNTLIQGKRLRDISDLPFDLAA